MRGPTIEDVIERLAWLRGREISTALLAGGHMNTVFLVTALDEKYVVRVPGEGRGILGFDRAKERHNLEAAAVAHVAPRVVDYLEDWDVMVLEYVEGEALTAEALGTSEQIPKVVESLRRLHSVPRFMGDVDWFATVRAWMRACDERQIEAPRAIRERMEEIRAASHALAATSSPSVPSHNDLIAENLIDDGNQLWLLDFEYSGNNDPCYDVGDVAYQSDLDDDWRARLCEAYFGEADPKLLARMRLHNLIGASAWATWAAIQDKFSTLDMDYPAISKAYSDDVVGIVDSEEFPHWLRQASGGNVRTN